MFAATETAAGTKVQPSPVIDASAHAHASASSINAKATRPSKGNLEKESAQETTAVASQPPTNVVGESRSTMEHNETECKGAAVRGDLEKNDGGEETSSSDKAEREARQQDTTRRNSAIAPVASYALGDDDVALLELLDVDNSNCISMHDLAHFLYFTGFRASLRRKTFHAILQELHDFTRGKVRVLSQTRRAFAELCRCRPEAVVRRLAHLYTVGYKREIGSLFDGGSIRYIFQRYFLSIIGFTNGLAAIGCPLEGYFLSKEVVELEAVIPLFVTRGNILRLPILACFVSACMYLWIPAFRDAHAAAEVLLLLFWALIANLAGNAREPIYAARDCRKDMVKDVFIEQIW